jgi:hypothetical protein
VGQLRYDRSVFEMEDRLLTHLQIVIIQKIRRRAGFMLTFPLDGRDGPTSNTIWINHGSRLHFAFNGSRHPEINKRWLEALMESSNSTIGLDLDRVPEPVAGELATTASQAERSRRVSIPGV